MVLLKRKWFATWSIQAPATHLIWLCDTMFAQNNNALMTTRLMTIGFHNHATLRFLSKMSTVTQWQHGKVFSAMSLYRCDSLCCVVILSHRHYVALSTYRVVIVAKPWCCVVIKLRRHFVTLTICRVGIVSLTIHDSWNPTRCNVHATWPIAKIND